MNATPLPIGGLLDSWKVLVVDDEPDSLAVAQILLEIAGAIVYTANNGQEGLQLALKHRPKLIISDLSMPQMSGWQLLHELKENGITRDIPVIALTAHAMEGDRARGFAAGFHNYLTKPLQPETFIHDLLSLVVDLPDFQVI
jgi:two-component system cell cycle response regulator